MTYGYVKSKLDGSEKKWAGFSEGLPKSLSYKKQLGPVMDQGDKPVCVPCSVGACVYWKATLKSKKIKKMDLAGIFDARSDKKAPGMQIKEALGYFKKTGIKTDAGTCKINGYAIVGSERVLKGALVANGPCVAALPVYDDTRDDFWVKDREFKGGHAVAVTGYNEDGFIIRNSWGLSYGIDGYAVIPYEDFGAFMEIWTVY